MDVASAVTEITAGGAAVATLGVAALVVVVGIKMWKRIRSAG